jgi:hypothetical protein
MPNLYLSQSLSSPTYIQEKSTLSYALCPYLRDMPFVLLLIKFINFDVQFNPDTQMFLLPGTTPW